MRYALELFWIAKDIGCIFIQDTFSKIIFPFIIDVLRSTHATRYT